MGHYRLRTTVYKYLADTILNTANGSRFCRIAVRWAVESYLDYEFMIVFTLLVNRAGDLQKPY